jgi:acyl carrier protein phosphodiesterase
LNYLGHAYFSFDHPEILVGNMISDFVKGKKKFDFPGGIQKGIALHRELDEFSDSHPATKQAKEIFRPHYRLYASAFMDVVYDYFIANDPAIFDETSLYAFTQQTYRLLEERQQWFPERFASLFPYMRSQNWLFNYRYSWGIERSFSGLVRRATYLDESATAFRLFGENTAMLQKCYNQFISDLKNFAKNRFLLLLKE